MNPRTYQAPTMSEALAEVKRDLGRDAVILNTRRFRRGGLLGLGGRRTWEITAAPHGEEASQRPPVGLYVPDARAAARRQETAEALERLAQQAVPSARLDHLAGQIVEIRRMVAAVLARRPEGGLVEPAGLLPRFRDHLVAQDVEETLAARLVNRLRLTLTGKELDDPGLVSEKLVEVMAESLCGNGRADGGGPGAGEARVIALIGPTGVGKTTTIAKLAADFALRRRQKVGLITLDTYRIAAVEQLRTYAEIIEVPLRVAIAAEEVRQARYTLRGMDVILVDTAGRSQNDRLRLGELRNVLEAAEAHEVHLVVSANANRASSRGTLESFLPLGANRILLTKLDEAATYGNILNIAAEGGVPLSYVTDGQEVPDDIAAADPQHLARLILRGTTDAN